MEDSNRHYLGIKEKASLCGSCLFYYYYFFFLTTVSSDLLLYIKCTLATLKQFCINGLYDTVPHKQTRVLLIKKKLKQKLFYPLRCQYALCFVLQIPPYSNIRLVSGNQKKQVSKTSMPQDTQALMSWVKKEYVVLTSYTELRRGNQMTLSVGLGRKNITSTTVGVRNYSLS